MQVKEGASSHAVQTPVDLRKSPCGWTFTPHTSQLQDNLLYLLRGRAAEKQVQNHFLNKYYQLTRPCKEMSVRNGSPLYAQWPRPEHSLKSVQSSVSHRGRLPNQFIQCVVSIRTTAKYSITLHTEGFQLPQETEPACHLFLYFSFFPVPG